MSEEQSHAIDDLESFRPFLLLLARTRVDRRILAKVDLSGVVQQTLLDAHRSRETLISLKTAELAAWLRRALGNNLIDEVRRIHARGRLPKAEVSIEAMVHDSSARFERFLADSGLCPAAQYAQVEQFVHMAQCLARLPDSQRRAIELHRLEGCTLAQTAAELGCTKPAVAGLLHRGILRLRELMNEA